MTDENEQDDAPEHPALKNFSRTAETVKHVLVKTLKAGLKGALIGGLVLGAVASVPALAGYLLTFGVGSGVASSFIGSSLMTGALAGAGVGAAIGLVSGVNSAEEAVDEQAQTLVTKAMRRSQLAANQEMMAMNMERMRAAARQPGAVQLQNQLPFGKGLNPQVGMV